MSLRLPFLPTVIRPLAVGVLVLLAISPVMADDAGPERISFQRDIQPIFAKRCFACHGPDEAEGGLSFATRKQAFGETDSGEPTFVPGDPASSEVIRRVSSDDEFERMPPEGDPVTGKELALLKAWVRSGRRVDGSLGISSHSDPTGHCPTLTTSLWSRESDRCIRIYRTLDANGLRSPIRRLRIAEPSFEESTTI